MNRSSTAPSIVIGKSVQFNKVDIGEALRDTSSHTCHVCYGKSLVRRHCGSVATHCNMRYMVHDLPSSMLKTFDLVWYIDASADCKQLCYSHRPALEPTISSCKQRSVVPHGLVGHQRPRALQSRRRNVRATSLAPSINPPAVVFNLRRLGTISPNPLRKLPALVLQLFILGQTDPVRTIDDRQTIFIRTPRIAIEQHLHALSHRLDRFVL